MEYVTKGNIATHTILFQIKNGFILWILSGITVINNIVLIISQRHLSITSQYAYVHVRHTHPYNWSSPSCYSSTAAFKDFYTELMPYTVLANSYGVSVYNVYQF